MPLSPEILEQISKNDNFTDKELLEEISLLFSDKPEATEYLYLYGELYGELCEVMDDLADEVDRRTENVEKAGLLRCKLSTCKYWLQNWQHLWMVERLIHHQYTDVMKWEKSEVEWQRRDAKALSHCAYLMFYAVVQLEFGDEKLQELSLRFREHAHKKHINDPI